MKARRNWIGREGGRGLSWSIGRSGSFQEIAVDVSRGVPELDEKFALNGEDFARQALEERGRVKSSIHRKTSSAAKVKQGEKGTQCQKLCLTSGEKLVCSLVEWGDGKLQLGLQEAALTSALTKPDVNSLRET